MELILVLVLVVVLYSIYMYNKLVSLNNRTKEAWSDIDTQLKRRYDLIPNLIETVRGYMKHEAETLTRVTEARSNALAGEGKDISARSQDENILSGTLKNLFAVAESYPDLKANQHFMELQRELSDTEDKIQAARRFYNSNVLALNTMIEQFPSNLVASVCRFTKATFFELDDEEKAAAAKPVKVQF